MRNGRCLVVTRTIIALCFAGLLASCASVKANSFVDDSTATATAWVSEAIVCETDPLSGAEIVQLTNRPIISTNVYQEQRFASADGTRIAISRWASRGNYEVWVCDIPTQRLHRVGKGRVVAANSRLNVVYYSIPDDEEIVLMRLNLKDLTIRELFRYKRERGGYKACVSPDERWFVRGPYNVKDNIYSLRIVDIATGEERVLCEVEDMFNPHIQFDLFDSSRLLAMVNRGGSPRWKRDGRGQTGANGATIITVDVPSGKVTPLPVGEPDTARISGHQCWIGQTGKILFTAAPGVHQSMVSGLGVYEVTQGDSKARHIVAGQPFNHLAVSDDGRFFIVDNHKTQRLFVGSVKTGRFLPLCDSHTNQGRSQYTHAHPYMTPDNKYVIFNSSAARNVAQVYAARIPDGFLEKVLLEKTKKEREPLK